MSRHKIERRFSLSRVVFQLAPSVTGEEARRVHRLRVPLHYAENDQGAVLDFAASVRGEDLKARFTCDDEEKEVELVVRLENAGIRLAKGSSTPALTIGLLLETERVEPIASLLGVALRAAKNGAAVDVGLALVQERLPGMEEAIAEQEKLDDETDAEARAERAGGRAPGTRRRPKGSSPVPRT